jgi:hypothetical protein
MERSHEVNTPRKYIVQIEKDPHVCTIVRVHEDSPFKTGENANTWQRQHCWSEHRDGRFRLLLTFTTLRRRDDLSSVRIADNKRQILPRRVSPTSRHDRELGSVVARTRVYKKRSRQWITRYACVPVASQTLTSNESLAKWPALVDRRIGQKRRENSKPTKPKRG